MVGSNAITIPVGGYTIQLNAHAYFSDGTDRDVTSEAVWDAYNTTDIVADPVAGLVVSGSTAGNQVIRARFTWGEEVTDTETVVIVSGSLATLTLINQDGSAAETEIVKGLWNDYGALATLNSGTAQYYLSDADVAYQSGNLAVGRFLATPPNQNGVLTTLNAGPFRVRPE
jgi:hypothetical protein